MFSLHTVNTRNFRKTNTKQLYYNKLGFLTHVCNITRILIIEHNKYPYKIDIRTTSRKYILDKSQNERKTLILLNDLES